MTWKSEKSTDMNHNRGGPPLQLQSIDTVEYLTWTLPIFCVHFPLDFHCSRMKLFLVWRRISGKLQAVPFHACLRHIILHSPALSPREPDLQFAVRRWLMLSPYSAVKLGFVAGCSAPQCNTRHDWEKIIRKWKANISKLTRASRLTSLYMSFE